MRGLFYRPQGRFAMPYPIKPLTPGRVSSMICAVAAIAATGIGTPFSIVVKTPLPGVFYCLKKIGTPLVRAFVMVARNGQPQGWPDPMPGSSNLLRVAAQSLEPLRGGLPIFA